MLKKITLLTALTLLFSNPAYSQVEVLPEEEVSTTTQTNDAELAAKKDFNDKINRQIYGDSEQNLKELVRSMNAFKRLDNPDFKDIAVDVNNKDELKGFIKTNIGVVETVTPDSLQPEKSKETSPKADIRQRARQGLQ